jgi:DNA modification methylase
MTIQRTEIIGDCTLHLADCFDVMAIMDSASIDFIFTDPPFGHNNNNGDLIANRERALGRVRPGVEYAPRPISNDGVEVNDYIPKAFAEFNRLLVAPGACCCCCGGGGPDPQFAKWSLWLDEAIGFKQMVVWDKGPMGMGWHYRRSYEVVLVGQKPGAPCRWYDETRAVENIIRPGHRGVKKIIPTANQHPTQKPVTLSSFFINLHSRDGDLVFDPFMGSGSTALSCVQLNRRFVGVELDPQFFDMACERVHAATRQGKLF